MATVPVLKMFATMTFTIMVNTNLPGCDKAGKNLSHVCWQDGSTALGGICLPLNPSQDFWALHAGQGASPFTIYYHVRHQGRVIYFVTADSNQCLPAKSGGTMAPVNILDALELTQVSMSLFSVPRKQALMAIQVNPMW